MHRPAEGRTIVDYLWIPDQYFRSFWNSLSNPSGKYKILNESSRKNQILIKYLKVTWLQIRMKDFFRFWNFAECFEFLESPKFLAQGSLIIGLFISFSLPVYFRFHGLSFDWNKEPWLTQWEPENHDSINFGLNWGTVFYAHPSQDRGSTDQWF